MEIVSRPSVGPQVCCLRFFLTLMLVMVSLFGCSKKRKMEVYDFQYYRKIPQIVGVTDDQPNYIFSLRVSVGYKVRNVQVLRHLSAMRSKLADDIRFLFSLKSRSYLEDPANEATLKAEMKELINRRISEKDRDPENRIIDVLFDEFNIYNYQD